MELNSNLIKTLKCLSGSTQDFSNETYSILIKSVFDSFIINKKNGNFELYLDTKAIESTGKNFAELKEASYALFTLISEMAKVDLDLNSINTYLEDLGFTNERIGLFREQYEVINIKDYFQRYGLNFCKIFCNTFKFPHIVDVNWRLDYTIKENNMDRINKPIYLIDLKVEKPGEQKLESLQFFCSVEQLQDFVYKLKEATKSIEKLMNP